MEVTRDEYLKALDIVEAYHKQVFLFDAQLLRKNAKTKIRDWDKFWECSTRLQNNLQCMIFPKTREPIEYIEDITRKLFMKQRNVGRKSWIEFSKLRGY